MNKDNSTATPRGAKPTKALPTAGKKKRKTTTAAASVEIINNNSNSSNRDRKNNSNNNNTNEQYKSLDKSSFLSKFQGDPDIEKTVLKQFTSHLKTYTYFINYRKINQCRS